MRGWPRGDGGLSRILIRCYEYGNGCDRPDGAFPALLRSPRCMRPLMTDVFLPLSSLQRGRVPGTHDLPYLLVNPPFTDPTTPYHSIPYLVGAAREAGYHGERCVDANLDA